MIAGIAFPAAAVATFVLTWPLRSLAVRYDILDRPGPRKAQRKPIPYLGGVAVLFGVGAGLAVTSPHFVRVWLLLALVCSLGVFDDVRNASVAMKLVGEVSVAVAAVGMGFAWHITDSVVINAVLSVLWMVGLCNAFNLLDNMDGLSSTAAAVPLVAFAALAPITLPLSLALAGGAAGFLAVNRPPARMYLGDAGSLLLGFGVAVVSIAAADTTRGLHSAVLLAGPVAVALFDTSLVVVSRILAGRPVQLGGRDHFSHRLQLLGWSRYTILFAAIGASVVAAAITVFGIRYPESSAWLAVPLATAFGAAWLGLLRVDPYRTESQFTPEVLRAGNA